MSWGARILRLTRRAHGVALPGALAISLTVSGALAQPAPAILAAQPIADEIVDWDEYTGRFEAVEQVEIRARVAGYLNTVGFEDGEIVKKGDLLYEIDPRPFEATVARAQAALDSANAEEALAQIEFDRTSKLVERNTVAQSELDLARAKLLEAQAGVASAEAELRAAELDLGFTKISAPLAGRIAETLIDPGNLISGQEVLTTIYATDPVYLVFTASEANFLRYSRLHEAGKRESSRENPNPVFIKLDDEEEWTRQGAMDYVAPALNPNSGTITGRAMVANENGFLLPGLFARMRIAGSPRYPALLIPDAAVLSDQSHKVVMVIGADGKVAQKRVKLGSLYRGLRVIREGLEPEDRVITAGAHKVRIGQEVEAKPGEIEYTEADPMAVAGAE